MENDSFSIEKFICVDQTQYFCHQNQPVYTQDDTVSNCEINVLKQAGTLAECKIVDIGNRPVWIALQETNAWIYAVPRSTQLDIVCNHNPSQLVINGVGILKASDKCIIKAPYLTLEGHGVISSTRHVAYAAALNISIASIALKKENPELTTYTSNYQPQQDIQALRDQLREMETISLNAVRPHDIHHYGLGYILLIAIAAIGA